MSNVYCKKTKKKIKIDSAGEIPAQEKTSDRKSNVGYSLKTLDYIFKIIFECPKGHLFYEEWHADKINKYGALDCLESSIAKNENIICPECLEISNKKKN